MKKEVICLVLLVGMATASAQCPQRYEAPDAKEWVEKNRNLIDTLTRAGWQELDEGYKWAVLEELSPEQKHDFFVEKWQQVLTCFEWSRKEKRHLNKMYRWLLKHPNLYGEERSDEDEKKMGRFTDEWMMYGFYEFGWSKKLMYGMGFTPSDLLDKEGNYRTTAKVEVQEMKLPKPVVSNVNE